MSHDTGAEGSDSAVYPELARANLLRMRGDYKAAESQCLTILRRYPNNTTANILLGDICAEKGDLDQSMQWYEMALDLSPESQVAQHKLESVKQRFKDKETAATVEQLGLPTTKSRAGIYALALIAAVFIFAVAMYFLGKHVEKDTITTNLGTIDAKIDKGPVETAKADVRQDDDLLKSIQATGTEGARVVEAIQDPRSHALTISYTVLQGEDPRPLGAIIAQQAFDHVNEAPVITLRGLQQGNLIYIADAMRSLYEETQAPTWTAEHPSSPNAWIDHILTHEWPEPAAPNGPPGTSAGADASTTTQNPPSDETATPPGEKSETAKPDATASEPPKADASKASAEKGDNATPKSANQGADDSSANGGTQPTSGPPGEDQGNTTANPDGA